MLDLYEDVRRFIDVELVRLTPRRRDPPGKVAAALTFNRALGDPQRRWPAIQVAGTSGKGTVCTLLAATLQAAGLRTGLHISPYLQVLSEKTWIEGRYASPAVLARACEALRPTAARFAADEDCPASVHGMASLALSYLAFAEAELDVAVIETGLGGRFDLVQGLRRELCLITDLALDHLRALGPTLEQIAWHKAGVMEPDVPCLAVRGPCFGVLEEEAARLGVELIPLEPARVHTQRGRRVDLELPELGRLQVELPAAAPFLARNAAVAAAALDLLARRGWPIRPRHLQEGFAQRLPGRFEEVAREPRTILDAAHNPHKLRALLEALDDAGPLVVVLGATGARAPEGLVEALRPLNPGVVTTQVELYGKAVVAAEDLTSAARAAGLEARAIPEPARALDEALASAGPAGTVVVTGSIYLIGALRERWYPAEEVLLQGTSWPSM